MGQTHRITNAEVQEAIDNDGAFVVEVSLTFVVTHAAAVEMSRFTLAELIDDQVGRGAVTRAGRVEALEYAIDNAKIIEVRDEADQIATQGKRGVNLD